MGFILPIQNNNKITSLEKQHKPQVYKYFSMCLDKGASGGSTDGASDNHAPPPTPSEVVAEPMMYLPEDILFLPNLNNPREDDVLILNMNIWDYGASSYYGPSSMPFEPPPYSLEAVIMKMEVDQPEAVVVNDHNNNKDKVENDNKEAVVANEQNDNEAIVVNVVNDNNEAAVVNDHNNDQDTVENDNKEAVVVNDQNDNNKDKVVTLTAVVDLACWTPLDPSISGGDGGVNDEHGHKNNEEVAYVSTGGEVIIKRKRGRPRKYPINDSVVAKVEKNEGTSVKKRGRGRPPRRSAKKRKAAATFSRSRDISVTSSQKGRKGLLKLAERSMVINFNSGISGSTGKWEKLSAHSADNIRVMIRRNTDDHGLPKGTLVTAATSFWLKKISK